MFNEELFAYFSFGCHNSLCVHSDTWRDEKTTWARTFIPSKKKKTFNPTWVGGVKAASSAVSSLDKIQSIIRRKENR